MHCPRTRQANTPLPVKIWEDELTHPANVFIIRLPFAHWFLWLVEGSQHPFLLLQENRKQLPLQLPASSSHSEAQLRGLAPTTHQATNWYTPGMSPQKVRTA